MKSALDKTLWDEHNRKACAKIGHAQITLQQRGSSWSCSWSGRPICAQSSFISRRRLTVSTEKSSGDWCTTIWLSFKVCHHHTKTIWRYQQSSHPRRVADETFLRQGCLLSPRSSWWLLIGSWGSLQQEKEHPVYLHQAAGDLALDCRRRGEGCRNDVGWAKGILGATHMLWRSAFAALCSPRN